MKAVTIVYIATARSNHFKAQRITARVFTETIMFKNRIFSDN